MVDEPDSNRWRRHEADTLPLSYRPLTTHRIDPRHTPRHCRAHRTGEASATNPCRCGCSADVPCIDGSGRRTRRHQSIVRVHPRAARAEASRHSASALHGVPCLETSMFRMLRDRAMQSRCDRVLAFANAKKKTPPGCGPEGVRVPREVGVTDLPCAGRSVAVAVFVARTQTAAAGLARVVLGDGIENVHGVAKINKVCDCEGRARYAFVNSNARPFVGKRLVDVRSMCGQCVEWNSGSRIPHAVSAAMVPAASTRDRAAWVARSRPDAGCRPGTHCDPVRSAPAGTAATPRRAVWPMRRSCR